MRAILVSCLALMAWPLAAAEAASPAKLDYTVVRNGADIGTHSITIQPSGDETRVDVATNIQVKLAFVTVYRFTHTGRELWNGNRLVGLNSTTYDDGTAHKLAVQSDGTGLAVVGDGKASTADAAIIPASLWNVAVVKQAVLLNTLDGTQMKIAVRDGGDETVTVRGSTTSAHHYTVTGQLERELWYDRNGTLVRFSLKGKDGSVVHYELR